MRNSKQKSFEKQKIMLDKAKAVWYNNQAVWQETPERMRVLKNFEKSWKKHLTNRKESARISNVPPLSGRGEYLVN